MEGGLREASWRCGLPSCQSICESASQGPVRDHALLLSALRSLLPLAPVSWTLSPQTCICLAHVLAGPGVMMPSSCGPSVATSLLCRAAVWCGCSSLAMSLARIAHSANLMPPPELSDPFTPDTPGRAQKLLHRGSMVVADSLLYPASPSAPLWPSKTAAAPTAGHSNSSSPSLKSSVFRRLSSYEQWLFSDEGRALLKSQLHELPLEYQTLVQDRMSVSVVL